MNSNFLSLNQAAKETGKSLSTIHKALKSGKLSYISKDENGYQIDPSELFRVFPKNTKNAQKKPFGERNRIPENTGENTPNIEAEKLKIELAAARKEIEIYTGQIEELKTDRDDWKKQAQTLLISSQREKAEIKPVESKKGFLATLLGKKD